MTLGQDIKTAVKKSVPSIEQMVVVTNHAAGTNPYFKLNQPAATGGHDHDHGHNH